MGELQRHTAERAVTPAELEQNIQEATAHGFLEVTPEVFQEKLIAAEVELRSLCADEIDSEATLVPWNQLSANYAQYLSNNPSEYLSEHQLSFCCYQHPVQKSSDVSLRFDSLAPSLQNNSRNLIFQQGLKIAGNLDAADSTCALPLYALIIGDLHCHNLLLSCWAEVVVTGNLFASGIILAHDGETGGRLKVHGNCSAAKIISGCMYPIVVDGVVNAEVYWLQGDEPTLPGAQMIAAEFSETQWPNRPMHTVLVDEAYLSR